MADVEPGRRAQTLNDGPEQREHAQIPSAGSGGAVQHELSVIGWLTALFIPIALGGVYSSTRNLAFIGLFLHVLAGIIGEHYSALVIMLVAAIVSSCEIYSKANRIVFAFYLPTILVICGVTFVSAVIRRFRSTGGNVGTSQPTGRNGGTAKPKSIGGSTIFAVTTLFLKSLDDNVITPVHPGFIANTLHGLQDAFFAASFSCFIASRWLEVTGTRVQNPIQLPSFNDFDRVVAFLLYCSGLAFLIAYAVVTAVISPEMSLAERLVFVAATMLMVQRNLLG